MSSNTRTIILNETVEKKDNEKSESLYSVDGARFVTISRSLNSKHSSPINNYRPANLSNWGHSNEYIYRKTAQMISEIIPLFEKWINNSTENSLVYIAKIKDVMDKYKSILYVENETRIFIGTMLLLFSGDIWENLNSNQLRVILEGIKLFKDGEIENIKLDNFQKQLHKAKIPII